MYYRIYLEDLLLIEYSDVATDHIHTVTRLLGQKPWKDYGGYASNEANNASIIAHLLTAEHHKEDIRALIEGH